MLFCHGVQRCRLPVLREIRQPQGTSVEAPQFFVDGGLLCAYSITANGMACNCGHAIFYCLSLSYLYNSGFSIILMGRNWPVPRERLSASAATQAA